MAVEAARRAEALLAKDDPGADLRGRVDSMLADITREHDAAAAIGKDQKMVERLTRIHDDLGVHREPGKADAEWADAFREYGVDVDVLDRDEAGRG